VLNPFGYGFRPFFLGASVAALLLVPLWAANFALGLPLATDWPSTLWHAHEMLFGFVCAAVAGFLLTAVPSWTGRRGFAGGPLVLMSGLWLLGRLLIGSSASWPVALVAAVDLAFLPVLGAFIAWPLFRERNRNTRLLLVLAVLWLCNAACHLGLWRGDVELARQALLAGVNVALILVTVIGGRITPSFTATALRRRGIAGTVRAWRGMTAIPVALMVAVTAVDLAMPNGGVAGGVALAAAVAQGVRLAQWQGHRTLRDPIVWILHLAYAWLPVGLALKALALLAGVAAAAYWLHALTIGALATMILGVMTRVSLGHTGRPLQLRPLVVLAYALLAAGALVRVFGAGWAQIGYPAVILASAALWTAAFATFLWVYAPILLAPRIDGKPG
jgi:uncharacterized protein involved in response to NO